MLVEESRLFQVTFHTLDLHQSELDQGQVLADVTVIADEVDLQLMQAVRCWETPVARHLIRCEQASVTMRLCAGLPRGEFALFARSRATSRATNSLYLFESRLLGLHGY